MDDEDKKLKPGLYIISLPIGNSKDITIRAIEYLQSVDEIYCEDTRVTNKILSIYKIKKSLKNYHDHNGKKVRPEIIKKIKDGKTIALVSDAGTPLISDPGYKLVSELKAKDLYVTAAPGASSPITALTLSGLPTNSFYFLGFLPVKDQSRKNLIEGLKNLKTTIILFESANKINKTLQDLIDILGNREMAICREMTKKFEEIITGKISDIAQKIVSKKLKGEIVIVLYGDNKKDQEINLDEIINSFEGEYRPSELAKIISDQTGVSKSIIYNKIIRLKEDH